jgi:hypothetical protein
MLHLCAASCAAADEVLAITGRKSIPSRVSRQSGTFSKSHFAVRQKEPDSCHGEIRACSRPAGLLFPRVAVDSSGTAITAAATASSTLKNGTCPAPKRQLAWDVAIHCSSISTLVSFGAISERRVLPSGSRGILSTEENNWGVTRAGSGSQNPHPRKP